MRRSLLTAAVSGALSCGSAAVTPRPAIHKVAMEAVSFIPNGVTVNRGDSIVWINKDPFPRTVTAAGAFDSPEMTPDASWTFTATTKGEIHNTCALHPSMKGTIVVR